LNARCHDNTATLNWPSILQLDRVWRLGALEPTGGSGNCDMRPEPFRLNECAASEILSGNPGGET